MYFMVNKIQFNSIQFNTRKYIHQPIKNDLTNNQRNEPIG